MAGGPVLAAASVARTPRAPQDRRAVRTLWISAGLLVVGYGAWWGAAQYVELGLHRSLGPAHHILVLVPLAVAGGRALAELPVRWEVPARRIALAGLVATAAVGAVVLPAARWEGGLRSAEVALLDGLGDSLVVDSRHGAGYPYVRFVNGPGLSSDALAAIDSGDGRLLALLDAHPKREPYELRQVRPYDGIFEAGHAQKVALEVRTGERLRVVVRPEQEPAGRRSFVPFLRVGERVETGPVGHWQLDASLLPPAATEVEAGVVSVPHGATTGPIATAADLQRFGTISCRFEARAAGGGVEALLPCTGLHRYVFGPAQRAAAVEEVDPVLDVGVTAP